MTVGKPMGSGVLGWGIIATAASGVSATARVAWAEQSLRVVRHRDLYLNAEHTYKPFNKLS